MTPKSRDALHSFTVYCDAHPHERFWQALRNWSKFNFILGCNVPPSGLFGSTDTTDIADTFYLEGLEGTRESH